MKYFNNKLSHHGVKGQEWGVRNGPPYPIEDKILKKGTRINSVSSRYTDSEAYRKNGKPIYTYRADEKWDNKVYKGPFAMYLARYRGAQFIKEHAYETTKDLRMPTSTERKQVFKDMLDDKNTKKDMVHDLDRYRMMLILNKIGSEQEQKDYKELNVHDIKTPKDVRVAYDVFNHAMEAAYAQKSTREYLKRMSEKYDAMVDDNNQGVYNQAHDPIIVFKGDLFLKSIESKSKYLTYDEIIKNSDEVREELNKKGINMKL